MHKMRLKRGKEIFLANWKRNPAFLNMDLRKQYMIGILFNTLNGKNLNEALPIITNWNMQLKNENISFTNEENELLSQIFLQELAPPQVKQFEMLKSFMKKQDR